MQLLKNSEIKKFLIVSMVIFMLLIISSLFISNIIYRNIEKDVLNNNAKIFSIIIDKYPDSEEDVIKSFINMNSNTNKSKKILENYGIDEKYINNIYYFNDLKNNIILINILFIIVCFILYITIIYIFMKSLYKKLQKINSSTINAINKNYEINVADNNEGEIGILNNNIYKITTALKEQNELLETDKVYLKTAISDISHQLKTPLTSLYILTDILNKNIKKKDKEIFLDKIHLSLDKIEWLISSLLKLAQLDSGTIKLNKNKVNVKTLINSSIESLSALIDSKKLSITLNGNNDVFYIGDFNWSKEAIINIIKNGIEHTPNSGKIFITWSINPIYTEIVIKDEGKGIPEKDLPFIFDRFYKTKNSNKDSIGIGLAMSKAIVNNQNGDITVRSELNKYTLFTIKFYK